MEGPHWVLVGVRRQRRQHLPRSSVQVFRRPRGPPPTAAPLAGKPDIASGTPAPQPALPSDWPRPGAGAHWLGARLITPPRGGPLLCGCVPLVYSTRPGDWQSWVAGKAVWWQPWCNTPAHDNLGESGAELLMAQSLAWGDHVTNPTRLMIKNLLPAWFKNTQDRSRALCCAYLTLTAETLTKGVLVLGCDFQRLKNRVAIPPR